MAVEDSGTILLVRNSLRLTCWIRETYYIAPISWLKFVLSSKTDMIPPLLDHQEEKS